MRTVENNNKFRHSTCGNLEQDATCFLIYKIEMAFSIHYSVIQSNLGVKSTGVHLRIKPNWKKGGNVKINEMQKLLAENINTYLLNNIIV